VVFLLSTSPSVLPASWLRVAVVEREYTSVGASALGEHESMLHIKYCYVIHVSTLTADKSYMWSRVLYSSIYSIVKHTTSHDQNPTTNSNPSAPQDSAHDRPHHPPIHSTKSPTSRSLYSSATPQSGTHHSHTHSSPNLHHQWLLHRRSRNSRHCYLEPS